MPPGAVAPRVTGWVHRGVGAACRWTSLGRRGTGMLPALPPQGQSIAYSSPRLVWTSPEQPALPCCTMSQGYDLPALGSCSYTCSSPGKGV